MERPIEAAAFLGAISAIIREQEEEIERLKKDGTPDEGIEEFIARLIAHLPDVDGIGKKHTAMIAKEIKWLRTGIWPQS